MVYKHNQNGSRFAVYKAWWSKVTRYPLDGSLSSPLESSIDSASTYAVDIDLSTGRPRSQARSSNFKKSEPGNKLGPSFEQQRSGL